MKSTTLVVASLLVAAILVAPIFVAPPSVAQEAAPVAATAAVKFDATRVALAAIAKLKVKPGDWPQWGGTSARNNTPAGTGIPILWGAYDKNEEMQMIGKRDAEGKFLVPQANIKWSARLGSQTYGNPVVANGKIYVGTNNGAGYIKRYPSQVDLGCLLCIDEATGKFLWQHSSPKLPTGRVHDWPLQGICDAPFVEGDRLWYVTSRGEVACLDTSGFHDGENDGPFKTEPNENKDEADVIWLFDMMKHLGSSQHNMCSCSVTCAGEILFVNTSNGVSFDHLRIPAPDAPSFFAMDRNTGKVLWSNKSPRLAILHGQWSSPSYAVLGGRPQVIFAGGDGWVYSFDPKGDGKGGGKLLWRFDANLKESKWELSGRGTRNNIIATPVVYDGRVYVAVGQDPEHNSGPGMLWCIDPTKSGDVSPTLAIGKDGKPIPFENRRRLQAVIAGEGETVKENPNSAEIWRFGQESEEEYLATPFGKQMHRSCGTVAIKNDLCFIADFSGLFQCLDARTGKQHWSYDMFGASWASPLIVEGKVFVSDEDGDIAIFPLTADPKKALIKGDDDELVPAFGTINMRNPVRTSPIVANNVLYIANMNYLFALKASAKKAPAKK